MRINERSMTSPLSALAAAGLTVLLVGACVDDSVTAPEVSDPDGEAGPTTLGLVEVTITGLGTGSPTATAQPYSASGHQPGFAVTGVGNADGTGDGTIQLEPVSTGSFTAGERGQDGVRYLRAIFRVRNAQEDGTAYDEPRENLTLLAVDTDASLNETAITALDRFDGSAVADPGALALEVQPTGAVKRTADGTVESEHADVLQVLTEDEAADILTGAPATVNTVFPYGFVVRNPNDPGSRTLPAGPGPDEFDGVVTFAFKLPLQPMSEEDPFEVRVVFLAVDDSETRLTESPQERTPDGEAALQARADALAAGGAPVTVALLADRAGVIDGHDVRRICAVRTAGIDPNSPLATLDDPDPCTPCPVVPAIVHVDSDAAPGGDGTTWGTAFHTLQDALDFVRGQADDDWACGVVDETWVAEGVYHPDEGGTVTPDDENATFPLIEGVGMYGGFAGGETVRDARDAATNVTVLSGDIAQDDLNADGNSVAEDADDIQGTNSVRVVTADGTNGATVTEATVLDGFTITAGSASGSGGGLGCEASGSGARCSPTLRGLTFSGNIAGSGGAVLIVATLGAVADPLIEDVGFLGNEASSGNGGAVSILAASTIADPTFIRATFEGNQSAQRGGAVSINGYGSGADFYNTTFRDNHAGAGGGGVYLFRGSTFLVNSVFQDNQTDTYGGAMLLGELAQPEIVNVTFEGNVASAGGAVTFGGPDIVVTFDNLILWGNSPDTFYGSPTASTARTSIIQGACPLGLACTDVIDQDPLFVNAAAGDLRLQAASPAIDAGANSVVPLDRYDLDDDGVTAERLPDLDGDPRVVDGTGTGTAIVDMGAYERQM